MRFWYTLQEGGALIICDMSPMNEEQLMSFVNEHKDAVRDNLFFGLKSIKNIVVHSILLSSGWRWDVHNRKWEKIVRVARKSSCCRKSA